MSRQTGTAEVLTASHVVSDFNCGSIRETTWLRRRGLPAQHSGSCRTYVVRRLRDDRVVGFHTLATGTVLPVEDRGSATEELGADPVPVIVLTHLGVDRPEQGQSLGHYLLTDALRRVNAAADFIGARALLVHTADARVRDFYLSLAEFEPSPTDPLHLFLSIKDLRRSSS